MTTYKVLSDNFTLAKKGETVDAKSLEGANIGALVDAGHLAPVSAKKSTDSEDKE